MQRGRTLEFILPIELLIIYYICYRYKNNEEFGYHPDDDEGGEYDSDYNSKKFRPSVEIVSNNRQRNGRSVGAQKEVAFMSQLQ